MPASLSATKRQASGLPEERSETLAQPSWLWAQLSGCKESGGSSFFWLQASVSGEPGIMTVCVVKQKKGKDSVVPGNGS